MSSKNIHNELLQRLMARGVDAGRVGDLLSRLRPREQISDRDLLIDRLMTRSLTAVDIIKTTRAIEIELHAEVEDHDERTELVFERYQAGKGELAVGQEMAKSPQLLKTQSAQRRKSITDVWAEYKINKSNALRNILMENYLHLVRYNAE